MEVPSEDPLLNGYFGQMYSLGMQNGSDPRFLQGIATLKHFDANQLEGDWPGPESVCTVRPNLSKIRIDQLIVN